MITRSKLVIFARGVIILTRIHVLKRRSLNKIVSRLHEKASINISWKLAKGMQFDKSSMYTFIYAICFTSRHYVME